MPRKNSSIPREFISYAESLAAMDDEGFANEFIDSEDTIESYILSVKNGETDFPNKEQLARASLCLMFSLPEHIKPRRVWNVINLLASPEACVSLYSIEPEMNELLVLARDNVDQIIKRSKNSKPSDDYCDLF